MKQRIQRIVKERCSNPRVGRRWALAVSMLVVCTTVGVALAQRRPARPEPRARAEQEEIMLREERQARQNELAMAGRRNVLERLRDQLADQARETEAALRERGDDPGEEGQILRAELETLHNQIQMLERQLQNLDRPRPARAATRAPAVEAPPAARQERLADQLAELHGQAEDTRRRLEEIDDQDSEEAQELRMRLDQTHARIRASEARMEALEQQREQMERQRVVAEERRAAAERERARAQEARQRATATASARRSATATAPARRGQADRAEETRARIEQFERQLEELNRNDRGDSEEAREIREALRAARRDLLQAVPAQSAAARRARLARELAQMEQELRQIENPDGDRATALRRELRQLRAEVEELDARGRLFGAAREPQAVPPTPVPRRAPANRALETEIEQLRGQVNGLNEQMQQMQKMLEQLIAQRPPGTVGSAGPTQN